MGDTFSNINNATVISNSTVRRERLSGLRETMVNSLRILLEYSNENLRDVLTDMPHDVLVETIMRSTTSE